MHDLMKQYNLNGQFRWMSAQMNSTGELTATLLIREEHLCEPALYEACGLTVVEAILGVFQHLLLVHITLIRRVNSWQIFLSAARRNLATGIRSPLRGFSGFYYRNTWKIYSERLLTLAGVYGFWKYVSKLERRETQRYFRDVLPSEVLWDLAKSVPVVPEAVGHGH